jgi:drug/metabolite transporter (DMT)-like permease
MIIPITSTLIASVFASGKDLCSKWLASKISPALSATLSFVFAIPLYLPILVILAATGTPVLFLGSTFYLFVLCRAGSDMFAELFRMLAFKHGDISLVSGYISLSPLFLLFTSPLITGDIPSQAGVVGVVVVTIGVFILTGQSLTRAFQLKGIIFGIIAAFFFSINHCFDRLATFHAHPVVSGFWMTLVAAFFLIPFNRGQGILPGQSGLPWQTLILRGFLEVGFMSAKLWALQYMQAPYVAALMKFALIFSIFGGGVFFKEKDIKRRTLGGAIIVLGSIIVIFS